MVGLAAVDADVIVSQHCGAPGNPWEGGDDKMS